MITNRQAVAVLVVHSVILTVAHADLIDCCPESTKSILVCDMARLQRVKPVQQVIGEKPILNFVKDIITKKYKKQSDSAFNNPSFKTFEYIINNSTNIIVYGDSSPNFENRVHLFEGKYKESVLIDLLKAASASQNETLKIDRDKNVVVFKYAEVFAAMVGSDTLMVGQEEDVRKALVRKIDKNAKPVEARCVKFMQNIMDARPVFVAMVLEKPNTNMLENADLVVVRIINNFNKGVRVELNIHHANMEDANKNFEILKNIKNKMEADKIFGDLPIAKSIREISIEKNDTGINIVLVNANLVLDTEIVKISFDKLTSQPANPVENK